MAELGGPVGVQPQEDSEECNLGCIERERLPEHPEL